MKAAFMNLFFILAVGQLSLAQETDDFGSPPMEKTGEQKPMVIDEKLKDELKSSRRLGWSLISVGSVGFIYGLQQISKKDCTDVNDGVGNISQDCSYPNSATGLTVGLISAAAFAYGAWRLHEVSEIEEGSAMQSNDLGLSFASNGKTHGLIYQTSF